MIRDMMVVLSEAAFWALGGVPLMNSIWVLAWIVIFALIAISPMFWYINFSPNGFRPGSRFMAFFMVTFFSGIMLAMGPPIVQMQMLQDCQERVEFGVIGDQGLKITECRFKDNFYGEWGPKDVVKVEKLPRAGELTRP